jgi:hypothetical protein
MDNIPGPLDSQMTHCPDRVIIRGVGHEDGPIFGGEVLQVQVGSLKTL